MSETYNMKALETFYGTGGYIVKGQEFFTTSKSLGDFYVKQGKAVYTDGNQVEPSISEDPKVRSHYEGVGNSGETTFYTSELERNVTSMANPVHLKIAVEGVNPEDLTVEVVRDTQAMYQTHEISGASQQQQQQPQSIQQAPSYQTQQTQPPYQQQYQQQYQQSQQQQSQQSQQQNQSSSQLQQLEEEEQRLIEQLHQLQQRQSELRGQTQQSSQQPPQEEGPVFEIRHVGGGWYDLPNGERVQGKANAEMRLNEIASGSQNVQSFNQQPQERAFTPNQERVQQVNVQPEDGASLNQAQANTFNQIQQSQNGNGNQSPGFTPGGNTDRGSNQYVTQFENGTQVQNNGTQVQNSGNTRGNNNGNRNVAVSGNMTQSGSDGQGNTGTGGNTSGSTGGTGGGASTSSNTGGGNTSSGGGNTGNSGGGASTSSNTGGGNTSGGGGNSGGSN